MSLSDKIIALKQLYPTGRAFKMPFAGFFESLHFALSISESQAFQDAVSIHNSILPDNINFTAEDATDWERRLGLISNSDVSLEDRKLAIKRKMNFPGSQPARQHYLFLQGQLQKAGFDVYVYENRFPNGMGGYVTKGPLELTDGIGGVEVQHGDFQHGDVQHGSTYTNIVANHIDEIADSVFDVGSNLRSTFFIGGSPIGSFADIQIARKEELRQLILKIKPTQTVGYLFINFF